MEDHTADYVISGGAEGKSRLNVLAEALYPHTKGLLETLGVGTGCSFLDNGCGGGNVSLMVAEMVGSDGRVVGLDMDRDILRLASLDAKAKGLANLDFLQKQAYDPGFKHEFDFTYARFLLSHLSDPLRALHMMKDATVPGGTVIAEDVHFTGHFSYPHNAAFERYLELYTQVVREKGGDAEIGPRLPDLFREAGIENVSFDIVQPAFAQGSGKWMAYITLEKIRDSIIHERLATRVEIDELLAELDAFTKDSGSIISLPRIVRVWGAVR
jgi:SAM-dependent methyltransferase